MATAYTVGSWAIMFSLAGLIAYFNYYKPAHARKAALSRGATRTAEKKKEPKKVRKVQEKSTKEQKPKAEYTIVLSDVGQDEEELSNKEFARQLSSAKAGTFLPAKAQEGARPRSIKQTRAQDKSAVAETSSDNGTASADADDDRSSLNSPELGATTISLPVTNGDVSDMLEARTGGPSILRVTSPSTPAHPKKTKPVATQEPTETKKQRQNRQKAELKKQIREEEENERKVLLEKQRRIAREAEGRAAKDGSIFMANKAPTSSAWNAPAGTENKTNSNNTTDAAKVDFLDTYTPKAPASRENAQSESELAGSDWQKVAENMSEEEQVRRAMQDSDDWKTVSKDKRKKKTQQQPTKESTTKESAKESTKESTDSNDESSDYAPPRLVQPSKPGQVWNMTLVEKHPDGHYEEFATQVQDSEWEVA